MIKWITVVLIKLFYQCLALKMKGVTSFYIIISNIAQKFSKFSPLEIKNLFSGFTLIELIISLGVFTIALMVAVPSFQTMILNNRLSTDADLLVNDLNFARMTALNQNGDIKVCPIDSPNTTTCGSDWSVGWIVVTSPTVGAEILLKAQQNSDKGPKIAANLNSLIFNSRGLAFEQANFSLCDSRGSSFARSVEVLTTGFIQSGDTPGQAIWSNASLTCP